MKYFTMVQMAKLIGIPESTARGYRDRFPAYIDTIGQGRTKRYTENALKALRMVATMSREGIPNSDIEATLIASFGLPCESQNSQSQIVVSPSGIVADESQAITMLAAEMSTLREQLTTLQAQIEARDDARDRQLCEVLREIQETRHELARPWWKRLFR